MPSPSGHLQGSFRLYVTGEAVNSVRARRNLEELRAHLPGSWEVEVVDVLESPARAEEDRVLATPTLIKSSPPPTRRIIGDLSDRERVLMSLGMDLGELAATGQDGHGPG